MTKLITPQELHSKLQLEPVSLIDVREPSEYDAEHIAGSRLIPLNTLLSDPGLAKEGDKPVVFICRSGRRSELATERFLALFPENKAFNLVGGLLAWKAAALPLVESDDLD